MCVNLHAFKTHLRPLRPIVHDPMRGTLCLVGPHDVLRCGLRRLARGDPPTVNVGDVVLAFAGDSDLDGAHLLSPRSLLQAPHLYRAEPANGSMIFPNLGDGYASTTFDLLP